MMLDQLDKKIITILQEDFPLVSEPYSVLAARIGINEDELLTRMEQYRKSGEIRRIGAVLRHREVGYAANALCAWRVLPEQLEAVAAVMTASPAVTHCYSRIVQDGWPYNFYIMLHGHTREECRALAASLSQQAEVDDYVMLFSTREWKKTNMRYFTEEEQHD